MEEVSEQEPHYQLGARLKAARLKREQSLGEVSGAVEIDIATLNSFESGHSRPVEEILVLLMSHLGIDGDEAVSLWELAGYEKLDSNNESKQLTVQIPANAHILYTDMAHVSSNNAGVVLNFLQQDSHDKATIISRVGMGKEQARVLLDMLQGALAKNASAKSPQLLPPPEAKADDTKKN